MLSNLQCIVRLEGLGKLKVFIHIMGSLTRYLPACSIVAQPLSTHAQQVDSGYFWVPPTERQPFVDKVSAKFVDRGSRVVIATDPHAVFSVF
jgi:hypothetical protein